MSKVAHMWPTPRPVEVRMAHGMIQLWAVSSTDHPMCATMWFVGVLYLWVSSLVAPLLSRTKTCILRVVAYGVQLAGHDS